MLNKLVLIQACTYDLAELNFEYGDAMQLVGGNNVGKSSLIYALNFLFVIDRRQMSFMGRKTADKTTMEYYFPQAEGSFLIFEISKRGRRYCVVVWRDGSGAAQYLRLHHAYERGLFFLTGEKGELLPETLSRLLKRWAVSGIKVQLLKNNQEVMKCVYHIGRNNEAVVWLRNSGHGQGAEAFSQLYRYLIDTRLIDMRALREILLLADYRSNFKLSYGSSNLADLEKLRLASGRVRLLSEHQVNFEKFRKNYNELFSQETELENLALAFRQEATRVRSELQVDRGRYQQELEELQQTLGKLRNEQNEGQQALGSLLARQEQTKTQLHNCEGQLAAIRELPDDAFLHKAQENLQVQLDDLRLRLTEAGRIKIGAAQLEARIAQSQTQLNNLRGQQANMDNWLLNQLAAKEEDRRRLASILHRDVARLDARALRKAINQTSPEVSIFDGRFELPKDWPLPELDSPEALASEISQVAEQLESDERLLATVRNQEELNNNLKSIQDRMENIQAQRRQIAKMPELEKQRLNLQAELAEFAVEQEKRQNDNQVLKEDIHRRENALDILKDKSREREALESRILAWQRKLESFKISTEGHTFEPGTSPQPELNRLFNHLEERYHNHEKLQQEVAHSFRLLKRDLQSEIASELEFIESIEQEFDSLDSLQAMVSSLISNISQRFATPAADFLHQYQLFRDFINQEFNRKLARVRISNIEALRVELVPNESLHRDLDHIKSLDLSAGGLFAKQDTGGMKVLRQYIEQGREILFSDLFTLQLKLTINGKEKMVDLAKQVESDGTDRMLRLVIVMQVISRLAELSPENRVVMFIDEIATIDGKNRPQLVQFCREHHFYPIFAAPEMVEGFDRYVLISQSEDKSVVIEENKHYIDVERA
jgi:hypothetical protein